MLKKNNLILIIILSLGFSVLTYIFATLNVGVLESLWFFVKLGFPEAKIKLLSSDFLLHIPNILAIVVWATIGIACYLLYYSLRLAYYYFHNLLVVNMFFTKVSSTSNNTNFGFKKRALVHSVIIFSYLTLLLLFALVFFPLSMLVYRLMSEIDMGIKYANIIMPNISTFVLWLSIFFLLAYILQVITTYFKREEFVSNHFPEQIDSSFIK